MTTRLTAVQLPAMLAALNDRERTIVTGRFGLNRRECTLRELADRLDLSAERVRQIEQATLCKLHAAATAKTRIADAA